jgi:hypothetical protein
MYYGCFHCLIVYCFSKNLKAKAAKLVLQNSMVAGCVFQVKTTTGANAFALGEKLRALFILQHIDPQKTCSAVLKNYCEIAFLGVPV